MGLENRWDFEGWVGSRECVFCRGNGVLWKQRAGCLEFGEHPVGYSVVLEQGSRNGGLVTESPELSVLNSS